MADALFHACDSALSSHDWARPFSPFAEVSSKPGHMCIRNSRNRPVRTRMPGGVGTPADPQGSVGVTRFEPRSRLNEPRQTNTAILDQPRPAWPTIFTNPL